MVFIGRHGDRLREGGCGFHPVAVATEGVSAGVDFSRSPWRPTGFVFGSRLSVGRIAILIGRRGDQES